MVGLTVPAAAIALLGGGQGRERRRRGGVRADRPAGHRRWRSSTSRASASRWRRVQPWYVLIEIASGEPGAAEAAMERLLAAALEAGLIEDAAIAQSRGPGQGLLGAAREPVGGAKSPRARPGSTTSPCRSRRFPSSWSGRRRRPQALAPGVRIDAFGHVGDGNIHYDVLRPLSGRMGARIVRP